MAAPGGRLALGFECLAQLAVIVDFAVEDDHVAPRRRDHRLVAGGREIDDRQPPVPERNPCLGIGPHALVVRPPVGDGVGHAPRNGLERGRRGLERQKASDAAHLARPPRSVQVRRSSPAVHREQVPRKSGNCPAGLSALRPRSLC